MTQQQARTRSKAYVRTIPTKEQVEYAARRQALVEARTMSQTSMHHIGTASFHPEEDQEGFDLEEDESYYTTRLPTSARRYQGYDLSPEQVYTSGNTRYHVQYVDIPVRRKSRQAQLPRPEREVDTDEIERIPKAKPQTRRVSTVFIFGVGMIAMLALFVLLSSAGTWIQITKDDLTYGRPRTFNIDAVVGHNDGASNPTHFIVMNLNRHVEVIEQPGGDASKMKVYQITTLFGDNEDLTPVTLSFKDLNADGKPDMLIHINNSVLAYINDNGSFRPAKPGEVKGLGQ